MPLTLPGVALAWTISAVASASFDRYRIKRKKSTESNYITIAEITKKSTVSYTDYHVASGVSYDYIITQVDSTGAESSLASDDDNEVSFNDIFIHNAIDARNGDSPTYCVFRRGPFQVSIGRDIESVFVHPHNAVAPVQHRGPGNFRRVSIQYTWLHKEIAGENEVEVQLPNLEDLVESHDVVCMRNGIGEVIFCGFEEVAHSLEVPFIVRPQIRLVETTFEENLDA